MRLLAAWTAALALAATASARAQDAARPEPDAGRETPAAREQARLCERRNLAPGAEACRQALALGIGPERRPAIRDQLARHLVALEDWEGLAEHFREGVRLEPGNARAWDRLGVTLLFGLSQPDEAVSALEQAARLCPSCAETQLALALALDAAGRVAEAAARFEEAERLDPAVLDGRPAARAASLAARSGTRWP